MLRGKSKLGWMIPTCAWHALTERSFGLSLHLCQTVAFPALNTARICHRETPKPISVRTLPCKGIGLCLSLFLSFFF